MNAADTIQRIYRTINHLNDEKVADLSMRDLEFYRDHFHDLSHSLNISGREFYPAFLHANDQHIKVAQIISHRVRKEQEQKRNEEHALLHDSVVNDFKKRGKL